jgi:hypothetical protein
MDVISYAWEVITRDALTLGASIGLAVALLSLLAFAAWPSSRERSARHSPSAPRSEQARALVASGASPSDVARRTGLSRDALALMRAR